MIKFIVEKFIKNENLNSKELHNKYGYLSGITGLIVNFILFVLEFFIGIFSNSIAITSDAFHNLTDVTTSLITLISFKLSSKPADKEHPFGHSRYEYIFSLLISIIIIFVGLNFIRISFLRIFHPEPVSFSVISIIIMCIGITLKLWLSKFNKYIGNLIQSPILLASAKDSFCDIIILIGAIISLFITKFSGFNIDGLVGMVVAIFIIKSGISILIDAINSILGKAPDKKLVNDITEFAMKYDYVNDVHGLIINDYGINNKIVSLHVEVTDNQMTILEAHKIIDVIEKDINKKFNVSAVIHVEPC